MNNTEINKQISEQKYVSLNKDNIHNDTMTNIKIAKLSVTYNPNVLLVKSQELDLVNYFFDSITCR